MPVPIRLVDRVVPRIGVAVGADAFFQGVPGVGGDEDAEFRVVVAGVEVEEADFGVVAFAGEALRVGSVRGDAVGAGRERRGAGAVGLVAVGLDGGRPHVGDARDGRQVVAVEGEERSASVDEEVRWTSSSAERPDRERRGRGAGVAGVASAEGGAIGGLGREK